jgi:ABC-type uncharacterized transport system permease subunit
MERMESVVRLFAALAPSAWVAAAAAYLVLFVRDDRGAERWAPRLAWTAVAVHAGAFASVGLLGICPMLVPASVVSGLGLAVGLVHLVLERRAKDRAIGVFPMSAAALFALAGAAADPMRRPDPSIPRGTTAIHVTGAILGYAGLLLAALFGALYLVQQRALKAKRFGLFWERLPSLELLDGFSSRSLVAGVVFLTLTIGFGHAVRRATAPDAPYWQADVVATNLLWLACVVVVVARRAGRIRPAASAAASVALFAVAMADMLVVETLSHIHRGI